jgi:hypothetical protein
MIYLLGALALVAALSGAFGAWEHKGKLAAEAQVQALGAKIELQNAAVDQMAAEGARKALAASKALKVAEGRAATWDAQAAHLRGVLNRRNATDPQDCKAAWQEIRKP